MNKFVWGFLAAGVGLLAGAVGTNASDTIRLGGTEAATAIGSTDTELVRGGHGGGGHGGGGFYRGGYGGYGGYRGGYYGGYGGYRGGYYGGYRGGYYGGYRGYGYGGYYRPFYGIGLGYGGYGYGGYGYGGYGYGGYGYGGYGYGGYGNGGYGYSIYSPYYSNYSYPINYGNAYYTAAPVMPYAATYQTVQPQYIPTQTIVPSGNGQTFPYDGGPQYVVPQSNADLTPTQTPRPSVSREGLLVNLRDDGVQGGSSQNLSARLIRLADTTPAQTETAPNRYTYRAYGEEPLPSVRR